MRGGNRLLGGGAAQTKQLLPNGWTGQVYKVRVPAFLTISDKSHADSKENY